MLAALIEAALRTLLLAGVVRLGLWLLRIRRAQLMLVAWTVILAASLGMPALQWATPLHLSLFPDLPSTVVVDAADQLGSSALEAHAPALAAEMQEPSTLRPWLEAAYFLVSGMLLLRLSIGVVLSLRLLGKAGRVRQDWAANAHVRISRDITAPVTIASVILLPADAANWPASMRRAVLAHERAHVARWDFAMLLLSQVNRAVFWFSPLPWWLHRRLAGLAELASDDHAMEVTGDRPGYAAILLEMGRRSGPVLRGLAMARPATLRYRIERILSGDARSCPVSPVQQMILAAGAAGLSLAAASSALDTVPPTDVAAMTEQQPIRPQPIASLVAQDMPLPSPPPLDTTMAAEAPQRPAPPTALDIPPAPARARPFVRVAAHAAARPSLVAQPSRVTPQAAPAFVVRAVLGPQPAQSDGIRPHGIVGADPASSSEAAAADRRRVSRSYPVPYPPQGERPVLRLIDDRTCNGVYMPEHAASSVEGGINMVRAKLFRDASGTSWLTFFSSEQAPVIQPVTVTHGEDKATASSDTVFTMVPRSARRLNGFIKRPYGTIDFDCGGSAAHLFDGGS